MREPGGGTLFSPVIEKAKLSVKVSTTESSESKRRLSNGGVSGYASYVGAKSMLAGSILPPAVPFPATGRLKGGNSNSIFTHTQCHDNNTVLDLSAAERLKELRARLEPFFKSKAAEPVSPTPMVEESGTLPHWGMRKRLRRSRFEVSKDGGAHELAGQARGEIQANAEDCGVKLRGHGWASRPARLEEAADAQFPKGASPRNGFSSRAAANIVLSTSTTRPGNGGRERERAAGVPPQLHKGEASSLVRQRSDSSSAEQPINNSNGHMGAHNRATTATAHTKANAVTVTATEMAVASVKPRLDLQTLEWPRILIALSRKEKEDDFLIFKGTKLPQRPKKRPKAVERALHYCMPGNSLCDLSRSRYDVREKKSTRKRPRGLKAMESMESESD